MSPSEPGRLGPTAWPDVPSGTLIVPLGSCEQHGPHLPLHTDTVIAEAVAHDLTGRLNTDGDRAVCAPAVPYGASGEHEGFDGTISIGTEALIAVLVELGRSATRWARRVVFVNGHGGNADALATAVPLLRSEGRDVVWLPCAPGPGMPPADLHAGWAETSMMLALRPREVDTDRIAPGDTRRAGQILPELRARGVAAVADSGVLGDPTTADASRGHHLLISIRDAAWHRLNSGTVDAHGMLAALERRS